MEPDLVAGLEVGDGGDGEGDAGAGDADIDFGPARSKRAWASAEEPASRNGRRNRRSEAILQV